MTSCTWTTRLSPFMWRRDSGKEHMKPAYREGECGETDEGEGELDDCVVDARRRQAERF